MSLVVEEYRIIYQFVHEVFPCVDQSLHKWRQLAENIPDKILRNQALASINQKRFHCQGGSVYALFPGVKREIMVRFIVAFQTISDYLDNLCDRAGCQDQNAFYQLHLAITEALSPGKPLSDYYAFYPHHNDGGYLETLVEECRSCIRDLSSYHIVKGEAVELASLYSELQSLKHISPELREKKMLQWANPFLERYTDISPWEFAAATGSTLGVFIFCALAFNPSLEIKDIREIKEVYFPYICGFHILLDYFIDQIEDKREGDLNFIFYYKDKEQVLERLVYFLDHSLKQVNLLNQPNFHKIIIEGMVAMYLSDPKASVPFVKEVSDGLLKAAGKRAVLLNLFCKLLRRIKTI